MIELAPWLVPIEYPGRGLVIGRDTVGRNWFAYWLTGRSVESKARELRVAASVIEVADITGGAVDELRHYRAARLVGDLFVVGNGDHVDDLAEKCASPLDLLTAMGSHRFEPDPPIRTPRIAAAVSLGDGSAACAVALASPASPEQTEHRGLAVAEVPTGHGLLMSTYKGSSSHVVTDGTPRWARTAHEWHTTVDELWGALSKGLRVGLVAGALSERGIDTESLQLRGNAISL